MVVVVVVVLDVEFVDVDAWVWWRCGRTRRGTRGGRRRRRLTSVWRAPSGRSGLARGMR